MSQSCLIIGGGICGPVAALALHRIGIRCHVYEARDSSSTIGGTFSLPPNALRLLEYLGVEVSGCKVNAIELYSVHTAKKLGELPFRKHGHSLRVMRRNLQSALLEAAAKAGIPITYNAKVVSITEDGEEAKGDVMATFADGRTATASFLLGCDGIHSTVRRAYVDSTSHPTYSGTAGVYALFPSSTIQSPIPFTTSALNLSKSGIFLTTFSDDAHTQLYCAAVMQAPAEKDKHGWQVRGEDHAATVSELRRRYGNAEDPAVKEMVEKAAASELFLYPIFELDGKTQWTKGRVLLLGDAAHAMPPQGESVGLALEDAVLLARVLERIRKEEPDKQIQAAFASYEKTRRPRINSAFVEAARRSEHVRDRGWVMQKFIEFAVTGFVWVKGDGFEKAHEYDVRVEKILL